MKDVKLRERAIRYDQLKKKFKGRKSDLLAYYNSLVRTNELGLRTTTEEIICAILDEELPVRGK